MTDIINSSPVWFRCGFAGGILIEILFKKSFIFPLLLNQLMWIGLQPCENLKASVQLSPSSKAFYTRPSVCKWMNEWRAVSQSGLLLWFALMTVFGLSCGPSPTNTIKAASTFQLNIHAGFLDAVHQLPKTHSQHEHRLLTHVKGNSAAPVRCVSHEALPNETFRTEPGRSSCDNWHMLLWVTWRTH